MTDEYDPDVVVAFIARNVYSRAGVLPSTAAPRYAVVVQVNSGGQQRVAQEPPQSIPISSPFMTLSPQVPAPPQTPSTSVASREDSGARPHPNTPNTSREFQTLMKPNREPPAHCCQSWCLKVCGFFMCTNGHARITCTKFVGTTKNHNRNQTTKKKSSTSGVRISTRCRTWTNVVQRAFAAMPSVLLCVMALTAVRASNRICEVNMARLD